MTNGEMIQKVFNCEVCEPIIEDDIIHVIFADKKDSAIGFDWAWWNTEYKEPTLKNDLEIVIDAMEYRTNSLIENIKSEILHFANAHCSGDDINIYDVFKVIDDCCEPTNSENPISSDNLSSETRKNSKKLENSTTKNDLAQERYQDLMEYFNDKEAAKTILEDRKEFKEWLERLRWYVKRADELARELEQLKATTKNDLAVDAVSRQDVHDMLENLPITVEDKWFNWLQKACIRLAELPPVTPQLSSELEKNSKKLEKNFGESDCISREKAIAWTEFFIDIYDAKTANESIIKMLRGLRSITPQETTKNDLGVDCNNCKNNLHRGDGTSYCATGDGMCHYECEEPTTKNDLGVDCISRQQAIDAFPDLLPNMGYNKKAITEILQKVPPLTPQEPTIKNDLEVDAVSRADVLKLMQDNWHTHNGDWAMQESMDDIRALSPVTPIRPKGHWIDTKEISTNRRGQIVHEVICSECSGIAYFRLMGNKYIGANLCPNCGSYNGGDSNGNE